MTPDCPFDQSTSSLSVTTSALYWMHVSVDVPAQTQARLFVTGMENPTLVIVKNHTSLSSVDTMSRDGVVSVPIGRTLTLTTDYPTNGTLYYQPYWAGFR